MKLLDSIKSLKPLEIGGLIIFILFIIFPVKVPVAFTGIFDSPLGILFLLIITVSLFVYTNPIVGVIFILVAYELIRRGSLLTGKPMVQVLNQDNNSQIQKDIELKHMNPPQATTLEEEVIEKMAPASKDFIRLDGSDFKPVMTKTTGASII
jgi:energy-coupling factor transporter transmembrane protein EcfT